jgi:2-polyprenyl-6-methoxyphenol hydroxylase-like FAD-dependent oxidoreductase
MLEEMTKMIKHANIPIYYNANFTSVLAEADEVTFRFADGSIKSAALLIGADGIHSKVRQYISPTATPTYGDILAITSAIETAKLRLPEAADFPLPVSISAGPGTFAIAPQDLKRKNLSLELR